MSDRGGVRSSARLNGDGPGAAAAPEAAAARGRGNAGRGAAGRGAGDRGAAGRGAAGRGRPASGSAAAAERRARAASRAAEVEDSPRVLRDKCRRLARALRNAKHLVVYTGAGISTAADIPDYRGPRGVWTRLQRGESVGRVEVSRATPTFTHMALTALWARGALKFVVSQNCDGLHLRAGLPRRALAELHGDMFAELCAACRRVYLRAFDTTERTARHAHGTRRLCHACGAELRDSIVHFGERGRAAWPLNWAGALRHAAAADVVLCLGSSLKVLRRYPRLWRMHAPPRARPQLYIVNLQWTPKDAVAALKINARCDAVMRQVARRLRLRVPRYRAARDPVLAHAEPLAPPEQHTSRRPVLAPRDPPAAPDASEPSSPSASDSDEELPLRHLAARLRAPPGAPPCPRAASPPGPPVPVHANDSLDLVCAPEPPDRLHAFQVSLHAGEATILLRTEHARSASPRGRTADLRRVRIARRAPPAPPALPALNGHRVPAGSPADPRAVLTIPPALPNGDVTPGSRLRRLLEYEPRIDAPDDTKTIAADLRPKFEADAKIPKIEADEKSPKPEPKEESASEASSSEESAAGAAGSLAAAIIRRAVLVCRASLYPGLHTILAAPPECAWCARVCGARRCLWYGPARAPPPSARAWRRGARGRRYLCACCDDAASPSPAAPPAPAEPDPGGGGWYGKGYRKGRRRR